jgi:hypothetical protein
VILELGGDQADEMIPLLTGLGLDDPLVHSDDDGRDRAIEAHLPASP